jgi:predicted GNAT family acetyltransferase
VTSDEPQVVRDDDAGRFTLQDAPDKAELTFRQEDGRLVLLHTEVDDELEGGGVGSALVTAALDHAEREHLTVVPACRFVAGWLERHPDRAAELDIDEAS